MTGQHSVYYPTTPVHTVDLYMYIIIYMVSESSGIKYSQVEYYMILYARNILLLLRTIVLLLISFCPVMCHSFVKI